MIEKAQFTCLRCKTDFEKDAILCDYVWSFNLEYIKGYKTRCPKCRKKNYTEIVHKYRTVIEAERYRERMRKEHYSCRDLF